MSKPIERIIVIVKENAPKARALGEEIAAWLAERSVTCAILENVSRNGEGDRGVGDCCRGLLQGQDPDVVLVVGGDGTFLSVARRLTDPCAPVLGVNAGMVGFLTDLCPETWRAGLTRMFTTAETPGGLTLRHSLVLSYEMKRAGEVVAKGRAVNDLVVNRGALARLVSLNLQVDGERVGVIRADGLILATPTGSTAYSVSAGGPLVHPSLPAYSVIPICAFLSEFQPLVLPDSSLTEVTVLKASADCYLTVDGQEGFELRPGDVVSVRRDIHPLCMVETHQVGYFGKLLAKGFVRQDDKARTCGV